VLIPTCKWAEDLAPVKGRRLHFSDYTSRARVEPRCGGSSAFAPLTCIRGIKCLIRAANRYISVSGEDGRSVMLYDSCYIVV